MALIKCPDCGQEVSDKATLCIKCGCPIGAVPPPASEPLHTKQRKQKAPTTAGKIILRIVLIVIGLVLIIDGGRRIIKAIAGPTDTGENNTAVDASVPPQAATPASTIAPADLKGYDPVVAVVPIDEYTEFEAALVAFLQSGETSRDVPDIVCHNVSVSDYLSSSLSSDIDSAAEYFKVMHPEFDNAFLYVTPGISEDDWGYDGISITLVQEAGENYAAKSEWILDEVQKAADKLPNDPREAVFELDRYMVERFRYDETTAWLGIAIGTSISEFLINDTGVCQQYADFFHLAMKTKGIPSRYAVSSDMRHIWNQVQIDGEWLNCDITWNDPYSLLTDNTTSKQTYLLKTDDEFRSDAENPHYNWVIYQ